MFCIVQENHENKRKSKNLIFLGIQDTPGNRYAVIQSHNSSDVTKLKLVLRDSRSLWESSCPFAVTVPYWVPALLEYVTFCQPWNSRDSQGLHLNSGCWTWDSATLRSLRIVGDFQEPLRTLSSFPNFLFFFLLSQIGNQLKLKYWRSRRKPGVVKVKEQNEPSFNTVPIYAWSISVPSLTSEN